MILTMLPGALCHSLQLAWLNLPPAHKTKTLTVLDVCYTLLQIYSLQSIFSSSGILWGWSNWHEINTMLLHSHGKPWILMHLARYKYVPFIQRKRETGQSSLSIVTQQISTRNLVCAVTVSWIFDEHSKTLHPFIAKSPLPLLSAFK